MIKIDFIGNGDDGLANRQTGKKAALTGNAREALETFCLGIEFARKSLPFSVSLQSRIIDTDDEDSIRVPQHTKVQVQICGGGEAAVKAGVEKICNTARGAGLMCGCKAEIGFDGGLVL